MLGSTVLAGRYEIAELLGSGGMGEVYRAHDRLLNRSVALKVLKGVPQIGSAALLERGFAGCLGREAKATASLSHPNIASVYDAGEDEGGIPYLAMEYVEGGTLEERIVRCGPLAAREAARIALQIAQGLSYAHRCGIIHRDIKPQNVLLGASGEAKVTDFGIARATEATIMTGSGLILGTPHYLSPEQAEGGEVGPQSDLYSLGITVYEMLTGEVPFEAESPIAVALKHLREEPVPPEEINAEVPEALAAVTMKLLDKDPAGRYASADELAQDLLSFLSGDAPLALEEVRKVTIAGGMPSAGSEARGLGHRKLLLGRLLVPAAMVTLVALATLARASGVPPGGSDGFSRGFWSGGGEHAQGSAAPAGSKSPAPAPSALPKSNPVSFSVKSSTSGYKAEVRSKSVEANPGAAPASANPGAQISGRATSRGGLDSAPASAATSAPAGAQSSASASVSTNKPVSTAPISRTSAAGGKQNVSGGVAGGPGQASTELSASSSYSHSAPASPGSSSTARTSQSNSVSRQITVSEQRAVSSTSRSRAPASTASVVQRKGTGASPPRPARPAARKPARPTVPRAKIPRVRARALVSKPVIAKPAVPRVSSARHRAVRKAFGSTPKLARMRKTHRSTPRLR